LHSQPSIATRQNLRKPKSNLDSLAHFIIYICPSADAALSILTEYQPYNKSINIAYLYSKEQIDDFNNEIPQS